MIHTAIVGSHLFTGDGKWIFICHQIKCQIIVPEIMVKSIICRNHQKPFDLGINILNQLCMILCMVLIAAENLAKLI